jgi:predicted outer membrane protein
MIAKFTAGLAALCVLTGVSFAQGSAKPTDPQIAHIA